MLAVQCGCMCLSCEFEDPVTGKTTKCTDPAVCQTNLENPTFGCSSSDDTMSSAEYSTTSQLPFCAIEQPSRFAPLYDLSGGLNDTAGVIDDYDDSGGGGGPAGGNIPDESLASEPILTSTEFMYTAKSAFGEAAMKRLVRQPDSTPLVSNPAIQAQTEVCSGCLTICVCL